MFTSRAEHRLLLREDNADRRLTPVGRELGLVDDARWRVFEARQQAAAAEERRLSGITVRAGEIDGVGRDAKAIELLRRPEFDHETLTVHPAIGPIAAPDGDAEFRRQVALQVETDVKYAGYVERQQREVAQQRRQSELRLPADIDYEAVHGLSNEARQKLADARPATIGQASRVPGVTPAAVSLLLIHLKKRSLKQSA